MYEVKVTSVRAVMGPPEKRCWVELGLAPQRQTQANIPGVVVGTVLNSIPGHQVGSQVTRPTVRSTGNPPVNIQDVQYCKVTVQPPLIAYWDNPYVFKAQAHRIQMTRPPGRKLIVNEQGEPRH